MLLKIELPTVAHVAELEPAGDAFIVTRMLELSPEVTGYYRRSPFLLKNLPEPVLVPHPREWELPYSEFPEDEFERLWSIVEVAEGNRSE